MRLPYLCLFVCSALTALVTVEGTVTNGAADAPLSGVSVRIDQGGHGARQTVTDAQGGFRIDGIEPGEYSATFNKAGFTYADKNVAARRFHVAGGSSPIHLDVRTVGAQDGSVRTASARAPGGTLYGIID